jgi:hypothetical protein
MKIAVAAIASLTLLSFAAPASAAVKGPIHKDGLTGPEVVAWLQGEGYKAVLEKDSQGDPLIRSAAQGIDFNIYFYDCEKGRCKALQFSSGFDLKAGTTLAKVNQWNKEQRYMKSFMDEEDDPYVQYDVNVNAGRTYEALSDDFSVFVGGLDDFADFVDF